MSDTGPIYLDCYTRTITVARKELLMTVGQSAYGIRSFSEFANLKGYPTAPHMFMPHARILARAAQPTGFDYPTVPAGQTDNFAVYYDPSLGHDGQTLAEWVLGQCEDDYSQLQEIFNGVIPQDSLPFNIIIAENIPGAYHHTCQDTDIYCDAVTDPNEINMLDVAEEVEVFEAFSNGWDCGATNGEALSRALAEELHPTSDPAFIIVSSWLNSKRADYITSNLPTDRNVFSNACGLLFLNWLNSKEFTWSQIAQAGGSSLAETYSKVTRNPAKEAFKDFSDEIEALWPKGKVVHLDTNNPFKSSALNGKFMQRKPQLQKLRRS